MAEQAKPRPSAQDRRALPVVVLGILVASVPFLLVPSPGSGGPITFAVRLVQTIAALVGVGVVASGIYSYRTGNLRPAATAGSTVVGLILVGGTGGIVETTGGLLIPIWVWALAALSVVGVSLVVTDRLVDRQRR